ncbi:MAG: hypothetical protein VR72_11065 [Clostridiaceae bacterium BRH_c20a]|nr:MAG: hypothetical protein VR72_11065 [Clostridiaceae bacterium BRH_c20a]
MKRTFLNITRSRQKNRIKGYYLSHLYQGQSFYGRAFNYLCYRVLVLAAAFIFFLYFTEGEHILFVFITAVSVLVIYHLAALYITNKKLEYVKREVGERLAQEEFSVRVNSMEKESFVIFIQDLLTNIGEFSQVEITEHLESEGIDLIAKYQGELVAIQCHSLAGENAVESRSARELSKAMSRRKYDKGIIISTTDFRDDTSYFCNLIREKRRIILLGQKELIQMAKDAGKYPREEEIKDLLLKKIEHQARTFQGARQRVFAKPRLMPYFLYGTVLLIFGLLIDLSPKYLYYFGAGGLYLLGVIGIVFTFKDNKGITNSGWQDKL